MTDITPVTGLGHGGRFVLSGMDFDEVSLVASGDNPDARVAIAKADPDLTAAAAAGPEVVEVGKKAPPLPEKPGNDDNWVDRAGGLPSYIDRIARHLHHDNGMTVSRAVATAVSTVKRWAAGGGNVNPDTRAKAVKAVAEWERMKASARISKAAQDEFAGKSTESGQTRATLAATPTSEDPRMTAPAAPAALPDSVISYIESLEGRVAELAKAAKPDTAKADAPKADAPAAGAVPAEVVEYVDALEDENDALLAALAEAAPDHPLVTGNAPAAPADAAAAAPGAPVSKADPATPAVPALDAPVDPNTPAAAAVATPAPELADPALADAISKADPAVQAAFAAAAQAVADANERAAAAAAQAEQTAIVAKAEQLAGLGNPAELASLLGEISKSVSPQTAAKLDEILHTAEVQISKSQMFGEIGTAGAPTTISKSAETAAAELRKSDPTLTEAQALARVYEQNPDLYTATLDEQEL